MPLREESINLWFDDLWIIAEINESKIVEQDLPSAQNSICTCFSPFSSKSSGYLVQTAKFPLNYVSFLREMSPLNTSTYSIASKMASHLAELKESNEETCYHRMYNWYIKKTGHMFSAQLDTFCLRHFCNNIHFTGLKINV